MAKKKTNDASVQDHRLFTELLQHHDIGFQETDRRATGNNRIGSISFDEADELFRSWLDENTWPYDALLFDPRIFTFIFEKTSRLIANKPKGKVVPREGSDVLAARVNNELLSYQWDQADRGGTMLSKWSVMDINARKYGASFALAKWRYEKDAKDKVVFDGPDMQVLNNRDVAHDLTATAIENCNWFQVRQYVTLQELKRVNDAARSGPIYKNLDKLEFSVQIDGQGMGGGDNRSTNWISRNRAISGLELDPVGKDDTFKTVEIVTEYRRDRWITFAPKHGVVLRDIDNPYENNELPIIMLRYYAVDDDLYGLSEIEPVKGLQKAINALLCQYVDEINQKLYSPIAIGPGVRQHTLEWGKGARWMMNNPMSDYRLVESQSNAAQFFNNTYSVLVAAMMNALGESSLGISNTQPYQTDKTATEVKALQLQRNARDQYNQIFLAEAIKRQYMLWHTMNKTMLFGDEEAQPYVIRIVGRDALKYFTKTGLGAYSVDDEYLAEYYKLQRMKLEAGGKLPKEYKAEEVGSPKFPINLGTEDKPDLKTKLRMEDGDDSALLGIEPKDLKGDFDFVVDVESMAVSANEERKQSRQAAVSMLATNPNVTQMLGAEGIKPKFKELFVTWLEDLGFSDADRYFEKIESRPEGGPPGQGGNIQQMIEQLTGKGGRPTSPEGANPQTGIPGGSNPNQGGEAQSASPFAQQQVQQERGAGLNTQTATPQYLQQNFRG